MQITYVGRARSVEIDALGIEVANGETFDAPDDVAKSLLRQRSQFTKPPKAAKADDNDKETS